MYKRQVLFNLHIDYKELAAFIEFAETLGQRSLAQTNRLYFGSAQNNARYVLIENFVIESSPSVLYVDLLLHSLQSYSQKKFKQMPEKMKE